MELVFVIYFFIIGAAMGSFYNVVGHRMPIGKSVVHPASHCDTCNHVLTPLELVPIFSYLFLGGKCKNCKTKIGPIHLFFEIFVGILFALSFYIFGFSFEFILSLIFTSVLAIVFVSDFNYMIILDETLIVGIIFLSIATILFKDFSYLFNMILSGVFAFIVMFLIKQLGNFLFKKESMGDGDIKLIAYIGFNIGFVNAIATIFLGSVIALPISLLMMKKGAKIIPFGPFLSMAAMILLFTQIDVIQFILTLTSF